MLNNIEEFKKINKEIPNHIILKDNDGCYFVDFISALEVYMDSELISSIDFNVFDEDYPEFQKKLWLIYISIVKNIIEYREDFHILEKLL